MLFFLNVTKSINKKITGIIRAVENDNKEKKRDLHFQILIKDEK